MKSSVRAFTAVFLTAIYCFALYVVAKPVHLAAQTYASSASANIIADFSADLLCHTFQAKSPTNSAPLLLAKKAKNSLVGSAAIVYSAEQQIGASFSQYVVSWRQVLVKSRKSDILFPFHYFW